MFGSNDHSSNIPGTEGAERKSAKMLETTPWFESLAAAAHRVYALQRKTVLPLYRFSDALSSGREEPAGSTNDQPQIFRAARP
jgi:hypothetical protein